MRRRRPHQATSRRERTFSSTSVLLLLLLSLAQLMVILDISAVNVALPDLAKDLGLGSTDLAWTITSYSVVFGSLLLLGGRAADLLGRRRVFLTGLAIFTLSSVASALAANAGVLFASRAGQGLGAALLSPAALSILLTAFREGRERTTALGVWAGVGAVLAAAAVRVVSRDSAGPRWRGLDLRGAMLATLSFGALVFAASQASTAGWTSRQ